MMKRVAHWTLLVAGGLALLLGLVWPFAADTLGRGWLGAHEVLGDIAAVAVLALAVIAIRAHVSTTRIVAAIAWTIATVSLAGAQQQLLLGSWHWTISLLHVATGIGMILWGRALVVAIQEREAVAAGRTPIADAAAAFLASKRIAITGVSRAQTNHGSNIVYQRLRERGYQVFAVNPNADTIAGEPCYRDIAAIPGGVDAVLIGTRAERALATMQQCAELGVKYVWMHRSVGVGSVSNEAAVWGREQGIHVIDGGCPLMFAPVADAGHRMMRPLFTLTHKVPRQV